MAKAVKIPQNIIGTPTSPQVVAPGLSGAGVFQTIANFYSGISVNLKWNGTLTTAPKIHFYWSPDGTTFFEDMVVSPITGPTGSSPGSGVDIGPYQPYVFSKATRLIVNNLDNTVSLNVLAMAGSLGYTIN